MWERVLEGGTGDDGIAGAPLEVPLVRNKRGPPLLGAAAVDTSSSRKRFCGTPCGERADLPPSPRALAEGPWPRLASSHGHDAFVASAAAAEAAARASEHVPMMRPAWTLMGFEKRILWGASAPDKEDVVSSSFVDDIIWDTGSFPTPPRCALAACLTFGASVHVVVASFGDLR